ncbi:MAG: MarR family transcriptional regulator [Rhodospirillales bacterium]|nr:MarR family transcriptional regulator [Rhodospirillales bacterium]
MKLKTGRLDDLLGHLLRRAFLRGQREFSEAYRHVDITPLSYSALELIHNNPGLSHQTLCKNLGVAKSILTTALKTLKAKEYINQVPSTQDGRMVGYHLSEEGAAWFNSISGMISIAEDKMSQDFTNEELSTLKNLLTRLTKGS